MELVFNKSDSEYQIDIETPSSANDDICMTLDTGSPIAITKEYTAQELQQMTPEELEKIASEISGIDLPSIEVLKTMDVGLYAKNGRLIGEKPGGEY